MIEVDPASYVALAHNSSSNFGEYQQLLHAPFLDAMEYILMRTMKLKELAER